MYIHINTSKTRNLNKVGGLYTLDSQTLAAAFWETQSTTKTVEPARAILEPSFSLLSLRPTLQPLTSLEAPVLGHVR